jgi:mycofactocin biosynthesis protein MftB
MCWWKRSRSTACAVSTNESSLLVAPVEPGFDLDGAFDLDAAWCLHRQVSIRPERFGALLYHFGTRRLSFLKSPLLLAVVSGLAQSRSARTACVAAGVGAAEMPAYRRALAGLAASQMICERPGICERTQS